jgi:hypothetical protein
MQRYRVRLGTVDEAARYADRWFLPRVREIPGCSAYYLLAVDDRVLATLGLFETAAGAEQALALARAWFGQEWGSFRALPPEVIAGRVLAEARADGRAPAGRRRVADRRSTRRDLERRSGLDRRLGVELQAAV